MTHPNGGAGKQLLPCCSNVVQARGLPDQMSLGYWANSYSKGVGVYTFVTLSTPGWRWPMRTLVLGTPAWAPPALSLQFDQPEWAQQINSEFNPVLCSLEQPDPWPWLLAGELTELALGNQQCQGWAAWAASWSCAPSTPWPPYCVPINFNPPCVNCFRWVYTVNAWQKNMN